MPDVETCADEMKRYVGFDETDAARVAGVAARVRPQFRALSKAINDRARANERANAVFTSDAQIQRLEDAMVDWLEDLFSGRYDAAHFTKTFATGIAHVRVGLPQRYIFGSIGILRASLTSSILADQDAGTASVNAKIVESLSRLLDIELAVMLESYCEAYHHTERQHQQERLAMVGKLAAGLAHEIRNPLNGARLHIALLSRSLDQHAPTEDHPDHAHTRDARESVHVIDAEIRRLARLVTDFLDFALTRPLQREQLPVAELFDRVMMLVAQAATVANVQITRDLPSDAPEELRVEVDPERVERALVNLVNNAIEAFSTSPTSSPAVADTGADAEAPNAQPRRVVLRAFRDGSGAPATENPSPVVVDVEDNGPGLPPNKPPIFDAFFSTKPRGTGLGLAIVQRIIDDHGGNIEVDSGSGRTRFRIKLPGAP